MKVTRLKRGYRIHLSDSEYRALCLLVNEGIEGFAPNDWSGMGPSEKVACRRTFSRVDCLDIDDDRRGGSS